MEEYSLVEIDDLEETSEETPIVYTTNLHSCICVVLHREDSSIMFHIEAYDKGNIHMDKLSTSLEFVSKEVQNADVFKSRNSSEENVNSVCLLLQRNGVTFNIYDTPVTLSNESTIGYNHTTEEYYSVRMEFGKPLFDKINLEKVR